MKNNNIILTGGHAATTAIAVVQELKKTKPDWNLFWVGVKPITGAKFISITTGRLQRKFTIYTIPALFKIPVGILSGIFIILKIRSRLVISFGGYAALPVCIAAYIFRIPIIIHEQTTGAGLTNKIVGKFAKKILIARAESERYFAKEKIVLVGNPIRREILNIEPKTKLQKIPTIYITGGSSGSVPMNKVIDVALPEILKKYNVIHQTGKIDFQYFKLREASNYLVYDFIDMDQIPEVFKKADFVISRAGANTVSEIMITKRPAILVPIPWVQNDEQTKNAKLAEDAGIAIIIKQDEFNSETLMHGLEYLTQNWKRMVNSKDSELVELDKMAAKRMVKEIKLLLV